MLSSPFPATLLAMYSNLEHMLERVKNFDLGKVSYDSDYHQLCHSDVHVNYMCFCEVRNKDL